MPNLEDRTLVFTGIETGGSVADASPFVKKNNLVDGAIVVDGYYVPMYGSSTPSPDHVPTYRACYSAESPVAPFIRDAHLEVEQAGVPVQRQEIGGADFALSPQRLDCWREAI